jgi:hypothetical protein
MITTLFLVGAVSFVLAGLNFLMTEFQWNPILVFIADLLLFVITVSVLGLTSIIAVLGIIILKFVMTAVVPWNKVFKS